jgi:cereblon
MRVLLIPIQIVISWYTATRFSFWMSNNTPLTEAERLELLKMHSTLERLRFLWKTIQRLTSGPRHICCAFCKVRLCEVTNVFTVVGAEGATSTYVNDLGYVHQITTLRTVNTRKISFEGSPSTHNSYFPGYSWHITRCRRCASLLGWKFDKVGRNASRNEEETSSPDRPDVFFGFMSSNLVTSRSSR